MNKILFILVTLFNVLSFSNIVAQSSLTKNLLNNSPVSLRSDVQIKYLGTSSPNAVRIVYDSIQQVFYSNSFNGDVYKISITQDGLASKLFISAGKTHSINRVQGLMWHKNELYLAGNEVDDLNKKSKGRIIKFSINKDGSWETPQNVLATEYYPSSNILFDHNFSALCLNKAKDSLIVASGSRTDHGEVKDVDGKFPNLREDALTSKLFIIPINTNKEIILKNDLNELKTAGHIYAEGVRNEFDIASNSKGEIFGVENNGDRDDPEELNLLIKGKHYGFPWNMGGNINPQQLNDYLPEKDLLLPSNLYNRSIFFNDKTFPSIPKDIKFEEPIQNIGPDANWVRDSVTGKFSQVNNISTFTSHRSPLGLVFDTHNILASPFTGDGFVLAYSTGGGDSGYLNNVDSGADLCQIEFIKSSDNSKYQVSVKKIVAGFKDLVDAVLVGNKLYILQNDGKIFEVTFPRIINKPSILISANNNSIIEGDKVELTAIVKDYWEKAEYSWKVNGKEVSNFNSNYSSNKFANSDKVTCVIKNYYEDGKQIDIESNTIVFNVKPIFVKPTLVKSGNCTGTKLSITSNPISKIVWKKDGKELFELSSNDLVIKPDSIIAQFPGIYTADVITIYGSFTTNAIEIFANSKIPTITNESEYELISSEKWGNQWYANNSILKGDTLQKFKVTTTGIYKLNYKNNFGCISAYSNEKNILILGIQIEPREIIHIYPNPIKDQITVQIPNELNKKLSISIIDNLGKTVLKSLPIVNGQIVSLEWLSQGSYYLVFTKLDGETYKTIKIMKE